MWVAGIRLSSTTDFLSEHLGLGEALGGVILLAITTNLPEIVITTTAAISGELGIAIGNILGGIAIQTVVLALLDLLGMRGKRSLTATAASLGLVLEAGLVIAVLVVAIAGSQMPASVYFVRVTPGALLIVLLWIAGLWLLSRARRGLPWHEDGVAPDAQTTPKGTATKKRAGKMKQAGTTRTVMVFAIASLVTLAGGLVLEQSGEAIASQVGLSGVLFGATFLAAATALPELSTGLASLKLGDCQLAMSDIFGGNAFLPVLFIVADLLSGRAVLPQMQDTDIYLTALGALLTVVYIYGLIFRPRRRIAGMGADSFLVVVLYVCGIGGLIAIAAA